MSSPSTSNLFSGSPSVLEELLRVKPRENSGSRSANRFEFQKSWAFCLMLNLHRSGEDYAVLLDFHDDVLVLDSATQPTGVEFFQIKTKKGANWTVTLLLKRDKGKNEQSLNSIVGKMFANKQMFPNLTKSLNFISNAQFKIKSAIAPSKEVLVDSFELTSLCAECLNEFSTALVDEYQLSACPLKDLKMSFRTDVLSLDDHAVHAQGQLADFLNERQPNGKFAIPAAFRAISTILTRRATCERSPQNVGELLKVKGICRDEFEEIVKTIVSEKDDHARWQEISAAMSAEGYTFGEIKKHRTIWNTYAIDRMDATNKVLMRVQKEIKKLIAFHLESVPTTTLKALIETCTLAFRAGKSKSAPFEDDYLAAIILFESSEE